MSDQLLSTHHYLHLDIGQEAPFRRVIDAEEQFLRVVSEVAEAITDKRNAVRWIMVAAFTDDVVRFRLTPTSDDSQIGAMTLTDITDAVAGGVAAIEERVERPAYFTDAALEATLALAKLRFDVGSVGIRNGSAGAQLTAQFEEHLEHLIGESYRDYGSVEGRVEGINMHGPSKYFNLYDDLTSRRVRCYVARRVTVEEVREALLRRVAVYGNVSYRHDGEPMSVEVDSIDVFPPEDELPAISAVRNIWKAV